jgi:carbon storage regulator
MLVLSRKLNETIIIADNIRVTVVGIRGSQVRLGIEAPAKVGICRDELRLPMRVGGERTEPSAPLAQSRQPVSPGHQSENKPG